jgi:hypothetical protein
MTVRKPIELSCREVVELVTEYSSNAMTAEDRVRFEQHLLTCPPCTTYIGQMKATVEIAGGLRGDETNRDAEPNIMAIFQRWKQK